MIRIRKDIAIVAVLAVAASLLMLVGREEPPPNLDQDSAPVPRPQNPLATTSAEPQNAEDRAPAEQATLHPKLHCLVEADEDRPSPEEQRVQDAQWRSIARRTLAESGDAENMLMAALLSTSDADAEVSALLVDAMNLAPRDPLAAWNYVEHCGEKTEPCGVPAGVVEQRALRADRGNGALWAKIAVKRHRRGDAEAALDAMRQAVTAPQFESYWVEHILAFERVFRVVPNPASTSSLIEAIGLAAALVTSEPAMSRICSDESPRDPQWLDACIAYGERLEQEGRTLIEQRIGLGIQRRVVEVSGDSLRLQRIREREERSKEETRLLSDVSTSLVLLSDAGLARRYVESMQAFGEVEAMRRIKVEVDRLLSSPDYTPCEP